MDGYSIKEAATVLGVPKRRVWELIARGVLSGAPEGDGGMRVFLQPRPGRASPLSAAREEPPRTNGNGGHAESGEGSPFREILTEFRSLTERYGQALLALGEARGEVAALRSRVELLEARLDLRLPGPRTSSTVAWEMPEYAPPASPAPPAPDAPEVPEADRPSAEAAESPVAEAEVEVTDEAAEPTPVDKPRPPGPAPDEVRPEKGGSRRRRVLRSHSAIAGIAEALERAQDPTLADLPGAREAAEALAALQREVEARTDTPEPEASIDEGAAIREAALIREPEPQAEPAAEAPFVEPAAATSSQELVDEEPFVDAPPPVLVAETAETESEPEPIPEAEPQPAAALETEQTGAETDAAGTGEAEPDEAPPVASAPSPYTTEIVEPDWFADGDFTWLEAAQAESVLIEEANEVPSEETVPQAAAVQAPSPRESEEHEPMKVEAAAAPAAEAIQDAFEPAEPETPEPATAVAAESPEPEPELVTEADQEQVEEAAPAAIQDAFEEAFGTAELHAAEAEATAEPEAAEPEAAEPEAAEPEAPAREHPSDAIATIEPEPEVYAAAQEPEQDAALLAEAASGEQEAAREDAGPAAEAIQDAFEPPEPSPPAEEEPAATATAREEPFAPADVAVFAVDQSEPERAEMPDTDAQARSPEARAAPMSTDLPPAPPRTEGLGGLAVQAAAPPAVQPAAPATSRPEEEELMWLGDEFEAAGLEIAAPGWRSQPQPAPQSAVEPSVEPAVEPAVEPFDVAPHETHDAPAHGMSDAELQQVAQDEGWDADEVDAIRTLLGRPTTSQAFEETDEQLATSGSAAFLVDSPPPPDDVHPMEEVGAGPPEPELEEAAVYEPGEASSEASLEAEPIPPVEWPMAEPASSEPPLGEATAPEPIIEPTAPEPQVADISAAEPEPARSLPIEESIRQSIAARPSERRPTAPDPEWLRRRRGPAARAYRRLRRLLPG
jgi:hypothetical protein